MVMLQLCLFLGLAAPCFGNTEITNFDVLLAKDVAIPAVNSWISINPRAKERQIDIEPAKLETPLRAICSSPEVLLSMVPSCPHEIWFKLALDDEEWKSFSRFTFRISWPASHPADFLISILDPEDLAVHFPSVSSHEEPLSTTRVKYARIRAVTTGVTVPSQKQHVTPRIPFIVTVEPLRLDLIPETVIPLLIALIPLSFILLWVVPNILRYVECVAEEARKEVYATKEIKQK